jgi:excisionase family DNA binding protein
LNRPIDDINRPLLGLNEIAEYMRASTRQVRIWIRRDGLPVFMLAKRFTLRKRALDTWLEEIETGQRKEG